MKKLILILCFLIGNIGFAAEVVILHTSDTHGKISPVEYNGVKNMGGFSKRVNFVNEIRQEHKNVLLLDSGDYFQGSLYYRLDHGKDIAKLLPEIKYDAIALGNHEFDDGIKILKRNIKLSKTQFLSANVHFKDKYLKKTVKPYIIKEFDGEKFLIIGVTTSQLSNLADTNGVTVTDPIKEIQKIIGTINYDKLIVLSHCGLDEDKKIAKAIPNIDLILGGHNHYFFHTPRKYGSKVPIIQDGEFGVRVGKVLFDENVKSYIYYNISPELTSNAQVDKKMEKINTKTKKTTQTVLAKTQTTLIGKQSTIEKTQTNLGRLVLISMAKAFPEFDAVLTNSGSIRVNRNIRGDITYADVLEILPFENNIVLVEIQGKYLKEILEYKNQQSRRYLQQYVKDSVIDNEKIYKVVTNSYVAEGKDGYYGFKHGKVVKICPTTPSKLLIKTLKNLQVLTDKNLKIENL